MKAVVLGADGMLGHEMVRTLSHDDHDVVAAVRQVPNETTRAALRGAEIAAGIDARTPDALADLIDGHQPDAVINAVGIVKQRPAANDAIESIHLNSLFPHQLAALCRDSGARLIHISTDCVFSGAKGNYREADVPDPVDLYGRSKLLGEISYPGCVTLRTSIIGLELVRFTGLVEWFLKQRDSAPGWTRTMYSGLTTSELARVVLRVIDAGDRLDGLWHVSGDPISKFDLLVQLRDALARPISIVPDGSVVIDRTMNSDRIRSILNYEPPAWEEMLYELAAAVSVRERHAS